MPQWYSTIMHLIHIIYVYFIGIKKKFLSNQFSRITGENNKGNIALREANIASTGQKIWTIYKICVLLDYYCLFLSQLNWNIDNSNHQNWVDSCHIGHNQLGIHVMQNVTITIAIKFVISSESYSESSSFYKIHCNWNVLESKLFSMPIQDKTAMCTCGYTNRSSHVCIHTRSDSCIHMDEIYIIKAWRNRFDRSLVCRRCMRSQYVFMLTISIWYSIDHHFDCHARSLFYERVECGGIAVHFAHSLWRRTRISLATSINRDKCIHLPCQMFPNWLVLLASHQRTKSASFAS